MTRFLDKLGLRVKATIVLLTVVTVLQGLALVLMVFQSNRHIAAEQATSASLIARSLARASELSLAVGDTGELSRLTTSFLRDCNMVFVAAYDQHGRLLAHDAAQATIWEAYQRGALPENTLLVKEEMVRVADRSDLEGGEAAASEPGSEKMVGRIVIGFSTEPMREAQRSQMLVMMRITGLMLLACGVIVFFSVAGWVRRLAAVVRASERISHGDLSQQTMVEGVDEIGRLASSFEEMRQALQRRDRELRDFNSTLQQRVEERTHDLQQATAAAQAAARSKTEFLANMSHEIRTPMTAIIGYADLLMETGQTPEQRMECIQTIRRNGDHLLVIINDILDISKIEVGKMQVERIPCSPVQIVEEVVSLMRVRAQDKSLQLTADYRTPLPATMRTDPTRLRQILMNLVGNALKFTQAGEVRIVAQLEQHATESYMRFDVVDTGAGMSREQIANLFVPFTQADTSTTRKFGGTGLGLTISSRLASMLGGRILVQSVIGKGSTFSVTVQTGSLEDVAMIEDLSSVTVTLSRLETPAATATLGGSVLLVEDGPDNQRLISHHLCKAGATVQIAENGRLGFEAAMAAWRSGKPFDLIVMDMQMPELDGYGATALLRQHGYQGAIVALTAHAMAGDRERCLAVGCDEYSTKPVERVKLIENAKRAMMMARGRLVAA